MMLNTLSRYFLKRYAITVFWFVIGVAAIIFLIDFSEVSGRFSDNEQSSLFGVFLLTLMRLPLLLQQTVPFIALFSGMVTLITLNRRSELVIARAAGISVWQFMFPFLLGAFLLGCATSLLINPLAALGQKQAATLEAEYSDPGKASNNKNSVPWMRQITGKEDTIIGATSVLEDGTLLMQAVFIHFDGQGRITSRQDARTAKLQDGYWLLKDVVETKPGETPKRETSAQVSTNLKQEFVQERLAQPDTVAFYELSQKIAVAKSYGVSTKNLETQFHTLLSTPFLFVAMTLIAATVSLKFSRFNQSRSVILGGIISGFVLYVATVLVKAFGSSGVVPPFVATWVPVIVATALGATILLHQEDG
ncbi:LPS export ABC transporter permease LptG [Agrobacterium vitis]|uniref:LPS export ABC transporter permease LptG n=1 Tax=Rhizobium/Agrobacterium group TaxID=227290 RepID=UPI0008DBE95F|nr:MULTISPECIES: LPS export ABC transporter permease LptG [Rhizobium/Agrobacterium group]MCF1434344.1 LPS export ABC transporter permease LptG [Allorhizobium ampelinum]MCF1459892.1 LPS export ABC transporter permease LptG [Allorhizobium ampelinum]MCF1481973.1 LPS export ABC transporter permease LptG [Allorhizobium ampelinum]MUO89504.1 LPS export ABC transporter permease LptG [Agrobacterium vitis]MUZ51646.1 LPS export ABC transporter permease LptG [Agrobacterium vitis]